MEKKIWRKIFLMLSLGLVLAGCGTDEASKGMNQAEQPDAAEVDEAQEQAEDTDVEADEVTATLDIVIDGESVADLTEEVTVPEGTSLLEAMHDTYELEEEGTFISAIEGYEQDTDAERYWLSYKDGEMLPVGAADYELEEDDHIEWRLEDSE